MKRQLLVLINCLCFLISCGTADESNKATKDAKANPGDTVAFVHGIDISKFQGDEVDYLNKNTDSLSFVICKATEGVSIIDVDFKRNWEMIAKKGFVRGAYHFYHCGDPPQEQAEHFFNTVGTFSDNDIPPIIDFEDAGIEPGIDIEKIQSDLFGFLNIIQQKTGKVPLIYTNIDVGNKYLSDPKFALYPLWIAYYEDSHLPSLPGAWKGKKWKFWQKSQSYRVGSTKDDYDVFNGSLEALKNAAVPHE